MCTEEHETELVVSDDIDELIEPVEFGTWVRVHVVGVESMGGKMTVAAGCFASEAVDSAVAGSRGDPATRVGRYSHLRPLLRRYRERLCNGVLGEVDVAEDADQGGEDAPVLLAEELRELLYAGTPSSAMIGRTSIVP
jgi:hypothetical protein